MEIGGHLKTGALFVYLRRKKAPLFKCSGSGGTPPVCTHFDRYLSTDRSLQSVLFVITFPFRKLTIYPVIQAAISDPSRTPTTAWVNSNESNTAIETSVISKYTLNRPKSLLQLREAYFTKASALIIATLGLISSTTPTDWIRHPVSNSASDKP